MKRRHLVAALLLSGPTVSDAQLPAGVLEDSLRVQLEAYRAASGAPGAVLGISLRDGRVLAVAAGRSDTARGLAMRTDDRLLMGSVGKTFVAAVALQLVAEGRLDLDAPASRYVGGQGWFDSLPNAGQITVRHLMSHTSGLVRYELREDFTAALTASPDKVWDPREQVRYLHGSKAAFAAGQGWDYSDTNYLVLALILEAIVRKPIDEEIALRFLNPHRLVNIIPSDSRVLSGVAQGYAGTQNPFGGQDAMLVDGRMIVNPQFEGAGGGYAAAAADAARWASLYFSGRLFGPAVLQQATTGVVARMLGPGTTYGLGMILRDSTAAGPVRGHSGFFPGYQTEMRYYPQHGISIVLMVNASNVRMRPPMARWLDELVAGLVPSVAPSATPAADERALVLAPVQQLLDGMRLADSAQMARAFHPNGRLMGMRPARTGGTRVQELAAAQFAAMPRASNRGQWIERLFEPEVRITGSLATVHAAYDFHFDTTFSHCGIDAFHLLKTADGWKITDVADTYETSGCSARAVPSRVWDGEEVLRRMRARWSPHWYRTLTFVQRTEFPGRPSQTWYESIEMPAKLRIDIAPVDSGNGVLYRRDSAYEIRGGRALAASHAPNPMAVLLGDVMVEPVERSAARLRALGFDLSVVSEGRWQGRDVWMVGGRAGDGGRGTQFFVDREHLTVLRILEQLPNGTQLDFHIGGHRQIGDLRHESVLEFYRNGVLFQREVYTEYTPNAPLDPRIFDPATMTRPSWIPR